jgi:hypothetical protein
VNIGDAQVLGDMPDAIRNSGCLAVKDAAPAASSPQQMVNFAHHSEVAILDENALTTLEILRNPRTARAPQANRTRHPNFMSLMPKPRD